MAKILLSYYSRTGNCRRVAAKLQNILHCDKEEIVSNSSFNGFWGFIKGAFMAISGKTVPIKYSSNPRKYDWVVLITPLWAGNLPPAVRMYVKENKNTIRDMILIIISNTSNSGVFYDKMRIDSGTPGICMNISQKACNEDDIIKNIVASLA